MPRTSIRDGRPRVSIQEGKAITVKAQHGLPTRALDTIYQNTTGRPIIICVDVLCTRANVANATAYILGKIGTTSPPAVTVATCGFPVKTNTPADARFSLTFVVPNGWYYELETLTTGAGSSVNTLTAWQEVELY